MRHRSANDTPLWFVALILALSALLIAADAHAQVAPGTFTTVKSTSTAATSMCVGCPTGTTTPAANSGITVRTIVIPTSGAPSDTTLKIYQVGGALFFNGLALATGSSISGTTNTVSKFTSATVLGDSTITDNGTTVTIAALTQSNGTVTSGTNGAAGSYIVNGPSATNRVLAYRTAGLARWFAYTTSVAESGGNAGSNFRLDAFDDAGTLIGTTLLATRSSLAVTLGGALTVTGASVLSGATTIATSLQLVGAAPVFLGNTNNGYLFRNSTNGATILSVTDAGVITLPGATTASTTLAVTGNFAVNTTAFTVTAASGNTSQTGTMTNTANSATFALDFQGANGGGITASNAAGALRFYTGSSTLRWGVNAAGDWVFGASSRIADSNGAPSITSGFRTSPSIAGTDYAFTITFGNSGAAASGGVVTFGHTYASAPACVAGVASGAAGSIIVTTTTTTATFVSTASISNPDLWHVLCRGY